ncbi:MAG: MFS transporter, partial [Alistipes inops]
MHSRHRGRRTSSSPFRPPTVTAARAGQGPRVIGVINGIAPVAAPVLGGVLTDAVGWRGIFVILLAIGVILLGGSMLFRESLPPRRRAGQSLLRTFGNFGTILRNKRFMLYVFQLGFAQGILFSNIASSPFIIQEHYGFSALAFSIVFAVNSLAFMAAAPLSLRFRRPQDGIMASCIGMCVLSVAELAALWCRCSFWVYEGILFLLLFTMALTFTLSNARHGERTPICRECIGHSRCGLLRLRRYRLAHRRNGRHSQDHRHRLRRMRRRIALLRNRGRPAASDRIASLNRERLSVGKRERGGPKIPHPFRLPVRGEYPRQIGR